MRAELGIQPEDQQQQQQQQPALSEEERAHRRAAKRLRQALARAETPHVRSSRAADASSAGFHSHMTPAVASSHPFVVSDERDHAETPFEAQASLALSPDGGWRDPFPAGTEILQTFCTS